MGGGTRVLGNEDTVVRDCDVLADDELATTDDPRSGVKTGVVTEYRPLRGVEKDEVVDFDVLTEFEGIGVDDTGELVDVGVCLLQRPLVHAPYSAAQR